MTLTHSPMPRSATVPRTAPVLEPVRAAVSARWDALRAALAPRQDMAALLVTLALIALWGVAIATFGYPALIIPALIAVPTIFGLLIAITWG